jgi:hypothetical protein
VSLKLGLHRLQGHYPDFVYFSLASRFTMCETQLAGDASGRVHHQHRQILDLRSIDVRGRAGDAHRGDRLIIPTGDRVRRDCEEFVRQGDRSDVGLPQCQPAERHQRRPQAINSRAS